MWLSSRIRTVQSAPFVCKRLVSSFNGHASARKIFINQRELEVEHQEALQDYLLMPSGFRNRPGGLRDKPGAFSTREEVIEQQLKERAFSQKDYFDVSTFTSLEEMMAAGLHFGHHRAVWNPLMKEFLLGTRYETSIINLDKTKAHLEKALQFLCHCVYQGLRVVFVNCRPHFQYVTQATARECNEYFLTGPWIDGVFTEPMGTHGTLRLPDVMILTSSTICTQGIIEANNMLIPTISLVDSDGDPRMITYPVPGNDDSMSSVQLFCRIFRDAILRAKQKRKEDLQVMNRITPVDLRDVDSNVQKLVDGLTDSYEELDRKCSLIMTNDQRRN